MWIYRDPASHRPIYELYERGGALSVGGGANIFRASDARPGGISMDRELLYEMDAKISKAAVNASLAAQKDGAVLAQVFSGFVIHFPRIGRQCNLYFVSAITHRKIRSVC